jgi:hypothetical protein
MGGKAMANRKMNSLPSLVSVTEADFDAFNSEVFLDMLSRVDPTLWIIKTYLMEYGVNSALIPAVVEQLARVDQGSGWGKVIIEIREHKAIRCQGIDDRLLNLDLGVEKNKEDL